MKNICQILLLFIALPLTDVWVKNIVIGFVTFEWKTAVKFVSLYFHLASDVQKRCLGHALSEISRRWQLLKHVPSAQSDPTRNKHKGHVVPARYGIICKCDYEGKKRNPTKLRIDMTLFKRFLHRALLFIPAKNFVRELSIIFIHHFVLKSTVLHSILLFCASEIAPISD